MLYLAVREEGRFIDLMISIIIRTSASTDALLDCTHSIVENTPSDQYEILIAAAGHTMESVRERLSPVANDRHIDMRIIDVPRRGFSEENNLAALDAKGEFLLFLHPALKPAKNWLKPMTTLAETASCCGLVGSRILRADGSIEHIGLAFDHEGSPQRMNDGFPGDIPQACENGECEAVSGSCLLIRKSIFQNVGGFDSNAPNAVADVDLCLKVRDAGLKALYASDSVLLNSTAPTMIIDNNSTRWLRKKWGDRLDTLRLAGSLTRLRPYGYYHDARSDLLNLIPESARLILDVGCAGGSFGRSIKERNASAVVWGIEIDDDAARAAQPRLDRVFVGDVEREDFSFGEPVLFDCIVFADVLEHLRDPWRVLRNLRQYMVPGGTIVASIPNIRHYSIIADLLADRWSYRASGILDIDHVRFFTLRSLRAMFAATGFEIRKVTKNLKGPRPLRFLNQVLGGRLDGLLTKKYYVVCEAALEKSQASAGRTKS